MTDDERKGMEWWNELSQVERRAWLEDAGSAVPADAWEAYKAYLAGNSVTVPARTSHP